MNEYERYRFQWTKLNNWSLVLWWLSWQLAVINSWSHIIIRRNHVYHRPGMTIEAPFLICIKPGVPIRCSCACSLHVNKVMRIRMRVCHTSRGLRLTLKIILFLSEHWITSCTKSNLFVFDGGGLPLRGIPINPVTSMAWIPWLPWAGEYMTSCPTSKLLIHQLPRHNSNPPKLSIRWNYRCMMHKYLLLSP